MPQTEIPTAIKLSLEILASGSFGAFAAYLFNKFHWKQTEHLRKAELILKHIADNVDRIESLTIQYWLSEDSTRSPENKKNEIQIKSLFRTQTRLIKTIQTHQDKKTAKLDSLSEIHEELFELATGDQFESRTRTSSPSKCNKISRLSADMRLTLIELIALT